MMSRMEFPLAGVGGDTRRMIVLEINEVSHRLLNRWMGEGALPNFRKLHARSDVFTTIADETDPLLLEPWIQWYSIHTGLPYDEHRVFNLTDGREAGHDDVFGLMAAGGHRVASFHSMNVAPFATPGSIYLGDPWCEAGDAFPPAFNVYNRFVGAQVREHSNSDAGLSLRDQLGFAAFAATHGLSPPTAAAIVRQLAHEKLGDPRWAWRRVALLDRLNFDVFAHSYAKGQPGFASFFSNAIAHLQHSYWRQMDPDPFTVKPSAEDVALYGNAIRFAYEATDRLIGRFMALAERHGATLMFASALGQKPFLRYEGRGGQQFQRLHDGAAFLHDAGLDAREVIPTMTHQYIARFATPETASAARDRLATFRLEDGTQVFGFATVSSDPCDVYFGCQVSWSLPERARLIDGQTGTATEFARHFYRIDGMKSGCHDPEGCLWIARADGEGQVHDRLVSILDILPTQLEMMAAPPPPRQLPGRSLAPLFGARQAGLCPQRQ